MVYRLIENVGMEAAVDILFASMEGLGKELSRNGRLCGRRLDSNCVLVLGDVEARLGGGLL
jgi:hypothetical protein